MNRSHTLLAASMLAAVCLTSQAGLLHRNAAAQQQDAAGDTPVDIRAWNTSNLYDGWSGEALLGEPVYGSGGNVIGTVADLIIAPDGRVRRAVVEAGGLGQGDGPRFAVPWNAVSQVSSAGIDVPVAQDNLSAYGLFPKAGALPPKDRTFRLREMLGDYVTADGQGFGTIRDVIFDHQDKVAAVIAVPEYGAGAPQGPVAFPFNADYFKKHQTYYASPYPRETLQELRPFDYDRLD